MKRVFGIIEGVSDIASGQFAGWLVFGLMCLVLVEVFARYVLGSAMGIADEIGAYLFVAITLIGLAYTWKKKGHTRIEFVVKMLSPKLRNRVRLATLILATAFIPVLLWGSIDVVIYSYSTWSRSQTWLRIPWIYPQTALIIGFSILLLQAIVQLSRTITAARTGKGDESR